MKKTTLAINFYAENITEEARTEFMKAVEYEQCAMMTQKNSETLARLETNIANEKGQYTEEEVEAFKVQKEKIEASQKEFEERKANTLEAYTKVVNAMSVKNENGFGNHKDVVRTVLRVLATWNNHSLVKYAIIPAFESPRLAEALDTIHVTSKCNENGALVMSKDVKEAYKEADKELENIFKTTFSLPFATPYTDKTRTKLDAEDKKLLNDCYVKGFKNKFEEEDDGTVKFKKRQVNTLVKSKKDRKTGELKYNYTGLANVICNIVIKHYFA